MEEEDSGLLIPRSFGGDGKESNGMWVHYKSEIDRGKSKGRKKKWRKVFITLAHKKMNLYLSSEESIFAFNPIIQYDLSEGVFKKRSENTLSFRGKRKRSSGDVIDVMFYIKLLNSVDKDELSMKLKESDVSEIRSRKDSPSTFSSFEEDEEFEKGVSIANWSVSDFLEWSKDVLIGDLYDSNLFNLGQSVIRKFGLNGKLLMNEWEESDVDNFVIQLPINSSSQRIVRRKLLSMMDRGRYDSSKDKILLKVISFLNTTYPRTKGDPKYSKLDVMKLRKEFGSRAVIENSILFYMYGEKIDRKESKTSLASEKRRSKDLSKINKIFPVKINIVENFDTSRTRRLRKILGKVLEVKDFISVVEPKSSKFGFFHCSLSIGNLQLEYVDSSLVIIREVSSENAILSADVGKFFVENPIMFARNLASYVMEWNANSIYKAQSKNCQDFCLGMLSFLKMEWKTGVKVQKFINEMKYSGRCQMLFKFDRKFCETFFRTSPRKYLEVRKKREFVPKSHRELDEFVQYLFGKCPHFERDYNDDYLLLKSFDRAFWIMMKKNQRPENVPAVRVKKFHWRRSGCPFTEPL